MLLKKHLKYCTLHLPTSKKLRLRIFIPKIMSADGQRFETVKCSCEIAVANEKI